MKKGVLYTSETYHSTSIDGYQLSITHLVVKDKNIYNKVMYGRILPCNLLSSSKNYIRNAQPIHA
jgi:hypothetical protein